jgi:hypothetical protein
MARHDGLHQALEGIKAVASLVGGAAIIFVVYTVGRPFLNDAAANAPGGYGGAQTTVWLNTGLDRVLPAVFLFLVFFGLVAAGVLSTRRY